MGNRKLRRREIPGGSETVSVKCFQKAGMIGSAWRWPQRDDIADYELKDVVQTIQKPEIHTKIRESLRIQYLNWKVFGGYELVNYFLSYNHIK